MKKFLIILTILIAILIVAYFILQNIAENKIENFLQKEIEFKEVNVNLWEGSVKILQPKFNKNGRKIQTDNISASGFSYYQYLMNKKIMVDELKIHQPVIEIISSNSSKDSTSAKKSNKLKFQKEVVVKNVEVQEGKFSFQQDSLRKLNVANFSLQIDSVGVNANTLNQKIPFQYKNFLVQLSQLDYTINQLQDIAVKKVKLTPSQVELSQLDFKPRFSREDYVEVIPYEKDLMNLNLKKFSIEDYDLTLNDSGNEFDAKKVILDSMYFTIYRDKTVKDDTRKKDLYSKMLRNLKLKLAIDSVKIKRAYIQYEELIQKSRPPGKLFFQDLNADIAQVTNKNLDRKDFPETKISIQSQFMGKSPIHVDWSFEVNNPNDVFTISGNSYNIPQESINSFFVPAFGMKTYGQVNELYFNFRGSSTQASGDLSIDYEDFKVEVLKKGSSEKNGIMSFLANIAVKKNSKKNGETEKQVEAVKRDPTKSFWNYFWKCIEAGLRKALIVF